MRLSPSLPGALLASVALLAAPSTRAQPAQPAQEAQWCWKALEGDLGPQDTSSVWVYPTLAAHGAERLGLAWAEEGLMRVRRWTGSGWEWTPAPVEEKRFEAYSPQLRFDASGAPVLAWIARFPTGERALRAARWEGAGWVALGEPLRARSSPGAEVEELSMALDPSGHPVVLWRETVDSQVSSLHVARWTGSAWEPLGRGVATGPRSSKGASSLALDEQGAAWVAWSAGPEEKSFIRVARWNGKAWRDVGKLPRHKGPASAPRLQLAAGGEAVLAWSEPSKPPAHGVRLARWTGKGWTPLAPPLEVQGGKYHASPPELTFLADRSLAVAWSEGLDVGFSYAYVQQLTPDGWRWLFRGLHLDEGQSNTGDLRLAATPDGGLFALLDEPGEDGRRTRLLHARPCAPGEAPAPLFPMRTVESFWPSTVDEAAERLVTELDEPSKRTVRETPRDKLFTFHFGWGMGIRNSFGLWRGNARLLESCGGKAHPDECSMRIIERVWERLQPRPEPDAGP